MTHLGALWQDELHGEGVDDLVIIHMVHQPHLQRILVTYRIRGMGERQEAIY